MARNQTDSSKSTVLPRPPKARDEEQLSLFSPEALSAIRREAVRWRREVHDPLTSKRGPWKKDFTTVSGMDVNPLATPTDIATLDFNRDLAFPGEFPFTRGIHPSGYRGRLWTMRQFAGFGTAKQTNERFHYLLEHGQTGLSVAFHLPTLYGYDSDHKASTGEVGKCGVAVDTLADMETLFAGVNLEEVTVSMTINSTAPILLAMYLAVAEKQKADWKKISGTLQADILKEYIAQKEYIFPPRPSMRLITDVFSYCAENVPKYNTISISGYHIREAGSTALQELAFTLRDGVEYVDYGIRAGLDVDEFAPRLSFFFNSHNDLFEEVAKFRAARRIWANVMRDRFGAKDPRSWMLRFHTQTAGCSLTAQQPYNNIVRVTIQALAAVLGGTQSLHTNSRDEALALPTQESALLALRTQQILAEESGVANTVDPLAGSYAIEKITDGVEAGATEYLQRIEAMGGTVRAIESGFVQREIQQAAYDYQQSIEKQERVVVGVNRYVDNTSASPPLLRIDPEVERAQVERLVKLRARRDPARLTATLRAVEETARTDRNLLFAILDAVKAYATVGEISDALRRVFGEYQESVVI
jgi:methylmalonyl-CoA mutase N-terminal domain/subunit